MGGELIGTKAIVRVDDGFGFASTIGQIEFTANYAASPIDISSKSDGDYVTYLDEELSQRQTNLSGTIFYNSDSSYRALRQLAINERLFKVIIVNVLNDDIIADFGAIITSFSDPLNVGEGIATSVTFTGGLFDDSIARGVMTVSRVSTGSNRFDIGYDADDPDFANSRLTDDSFIEEYGVIKNLTVRSFGGNLGNPLSYRAQIFVDRNFTGRLTPQSLRLELNNKSATIVDPTYFLGNPNGEAWDCEFEGPDELRFQDEDSAPATAVKDLTLDTIANVQDGDQITYAIFPIKPPIPLSNGSLSVGKFIDTTPGQEQTTLGLYIDDSEPLNDYGSLTPNYISEQSANQLNAIQITKTDSGDYSNITLKVRPLGQENTRNLQIKIKDLTFWLIQTDNDSRLYENTSLITRQVIYDLFLSANTSGQLLPVKINGLPNTLNGLSSITPATQITGDEEKNGVDTGFG